MWPSQVQAQLEAATLADLPRPRSDFEPLLLSFRAVFWNSESESNRIKAVRNRINSDSKFGKDQNSSPKGGIYDQCDFWTCLLEITPVENAPKKLGKFDLHLHWYPFCGFQLWPFSKDRIGLSSNWRLLWAENTWLDANLLILYSILLLPLPIPLHQATCKAKTPTFQCQRCLIRPQNKYGLDGGSSALVVGF